MQTYAIRLYNFMRFGEKNNSIVFDISPEDEKRLNEGTVTYDEIYNEFATDPLAKIKESKNRGLSNLIGIIGKIDGDLDISNGVGKCFAKGTRVLMFDGTTKPVEDIVVGDLVMGPDSKFREVISCHNGTGELYEVKQHRKGSYVVNGKHELILETKDKKYNRYKNSKFTLKDNLFKISVEDYLDQSKTFKILMGGIQSKGINFPFQEVKIDPYLLGVWLGDGNSDSPSFTSVDQEIIDVLYSEAKKRGLKINPNDIHYRFSSRKNNVLLSHELMAFELQKKGLKYKEIQIEIAKKMPQFENGKIPSEVSVWRWIKKAKKLKEFVLYESQDDIKSRNSLRDDLNHYSLINNKHIPREYLNNSHEIRMKVLAGLIDSDGHLDKAMHEITLKNEKLAKDVEFLARSLGFFVNRRLVTKRCCNNNFSGEYWRISIIGNNHIIPNKLKRKQAPLRKINKNPLITKINVNPIGIGEYYGFQTNGDHLFLLEDFTIVHNSTILEGICYAHYEKIVRQTANTDKTGVAGLSVVTKINGEYPKGLRESYVEEFFEESGKIYRIKRGRSFSKSQKSNSPIIEFECLSDNKSKEGHRSTDTKESIEEINVNDYDIFVNSQMMGQNDAGKFLTGTDKVQKEMVVNLLKMDHAVEKCLSLARDKKNKNLKEIEKSEIKFQSTKNELKKAHLSVFENEDFDFENLETTLDLFDNGIKIEKDSIKHIEKEIQSLESKINDLKSSDKIKEKERIKNDGQKVKSQLESLKEDKFKEANSWKDLENSLAKSIEQNETEKDRLVKKLETLKREVISMKKVNFGDATYSEEEDSKNEENKKKLEKDLKENKEKSSKLREDKEKLIKEVGEQEGELNYIKLQGKKIKDNLSKVPDGGTFQCPECDSDVPKEHFETKLEERKKEYKAKQSVIDKLNVKKKVVEENEEVLNKEKSEIADKLLVCDTYTKSKADYQAHIKSLEDKKQMGKDTKTSLNNLIQSLENSKEQYENAKKQLTNIDKKYADKEEQFNKDLVDLKSKYQKLDVETKEIQAEINKLEKSRKEKEDFKSESNSAIGSLTEKKKRFKELIEYSKDQVKEFEELQIKKDRYAKLEKYFGLEGVQTRIVRKYLPLLNVYIKEFLDILSNGKIEVEFTISDKSKIDCIIKGGTANSFQMLSGGEKMIVRLAVDIGLSLLSFSRSSQTPEMVCLDEIFGPLDKSKSQAVFKMLKVLQDKFKRVILISHDQEIQSMVDKNIVVEKDSGMYGLSRIATIESSY